MKLKTPNFKKSDADLSKKSKDKTKAARLFKKRSEEPESAEPKKKSSLSLNKLFAKKEKTVFEKPPEILELPPFETKHRVLDRYWLTPPYAYANLYADEYNRVHYSIVEPKLDEKEYVVLEETHEYLRGILVYDKPSERAVADANDDVLREGINTFYPEITPERREILLYYLKRNFLGYGKLDPLLHDDMIEDITCNGSDIPLYIYHRRYANVKTDCVFNARELNKYVLKLAQKADKQLSLTTPLADAALPEGSRVQLAYSDVISSKGSSFTIRKFKAEPMTPADLVALNTSDAELMAHIWLAVENRKSMIIAGGTASGKTSTMNAVSFFIPSVSKIVSIEDTREIQLPHGNWMSMKTRESLAGASAGDITMFSLLKSALRQRPEYIIVGEVRGEEAQTLFQAMNTGHTTYSTLHAGNVSEAINRLTNDPINVPVAMFGALDLVLVQGLLYGEGKGFRRCLSLNEVSVEGDKISWNPLFVWNGKTDKFDKVYKRSEVFENIAYMNNWSGEKLENMIRNRTKALEKMAFDKNRDADSVAKTIIETSFEERENYE